LEFIIEPAKVKFVSHGPFMRQTRDEVDAYLASSGTRYRGSLRLYLKAPVALGLVAASWSTLMFRPGILIALLCVLGLIAGALLVAFCIQHDANHGAYFGSRRWNHLVGWSADTLLGFSSYAWRVKHNVAHHTYTNIDALDADITQVPLARFSPSQTPRRWYRYQHLYIWPLYLLMGLRWQIAGDAVAFVRGRIGGSTLRAPRRWELAAVIGGKAAFLAWAVAVPLLVYPWWLVTVTYVGFSMVTSLIMATTFQLAHCVEEATFASPAEVRDTPPIWAVHEVETTVDFCADNAFLTWILGGLNYQIEHHLFPRTPHTHYPAIAEIVRRNCSRYGIRYTVQPSLRVALRSHYRHLRTMGQLGLPVALEMG